MLILTSPIGTWTWQYKSEVFFSNPSMTFKCIRYRDVIYYNRIYLTIWNIILCIDIRRFILNNDKSSNFKPIFSLGVFLKSEFFNHNSLHCDFDKAFHLSPSLNKILKIKTFIRLPFRV
jgi:ABC-type transport system involved in Fe-S cluster assembly fused permease/ATPase subunit